jgi:hypothetical protein
MTETNLERAIRRVREGEARVARQREISAFLDQRGSLRAHEQATSLLTTFETSLQQQKQHLADEQRKHFGNARRAARTFSHPA